MTKPRRSTSVTLPWRPHDECCRTPQRAGSVPSESSENKQVDAAHSSAQPRITNETDINAVFTSYCTHTTIRWDNYTFQACTHTHRPGVLLEWSSTLVPSSSSVWLEHLVSGELKLGLLLSPMFRVADHLQKTPPNKHLQQSVSTTQVRRERSAVVGSVKPKVKVRWKNSKAWWKRRRGFTYTALPFESRARSSPQPLNSRRLGVRVS